VYRLNRQYLAYSNEHVRLGAAYFAGTTSAKYWRSKMTVWPELAPIAMKWLQVPTSSIAAERSFAIARIVDEVHRQSQTWETFCLEVFLRVNKNFVESLLFDAVNA
jgi:hypothetical protein